MVEGRKTPALDGLVPRRPPIGGEYLVEGWQVRRRIAVAIEAPLHGQRRGLPHQRHMPGHSREHVVQPTPLAIWTL